MKLRNKTSLNEIPMKDALVCSRSGEALMRTSTKTAARISQLMKSLALTLAVGAALAGLAPAQTISWSGKGTTVISTTTNWYQPKIAGDGVANFIMVGLDSGTSLGPLSYWTSFNEYLGGETSLNGILYTQEYDVGVSPSVALVEQGIVGITGAVVEVHQGGQRDGAALWSHVALYNPPPIENTLTFTDALEYDTGYNASVAADPNRFFGSIPSMTDLVVEVHQAGAGISDLWYHVGTLTFCCATMYTNYNEVSLTWGPSYQFDYGYLPSVTVCGGEAVEVHEGNPGSLWYSVGTVSGNTISWTTSKKYDNGYAPFVTCEDQSSPPRVVEVHQATNPAAGESTALWYHIAPFTSSSVSWSPAQKYDTGCNPSVAFDTTYYSYPTQYLVEAHLNTCGELGPLLYDFGSIKIP
jgi:hypothetical protein